METPPLVGFLLFRVFHFEWVTLLILIHDFDHKALIFMDPLAKCRLKG
jgi:hypothetical protein